MKLELLNKLPLITRNGQNQKQALPNILSGLGRMLNMFKAGSGHRLKKFLI
jgi:hypothetical protein